MARTKQTEQDKRRGKTLPRQVDAKKSEPATGGVKRPHRYRPGTVALRKIRRYQKNSDKMNVVPWARLQGYVKFIIQDEGYRVRASKEFLKVVMAALTAYMQQMAYNAGLCALHAKRVTVKPADHELADVLVHSKVFGRSK